MSEINIQTLPIINCRLHGLENLTSVSLAYNALTKVTILQCTNPKVLDLRNNQISFFQLCSNMFFKHMKILLDNNELSSLSVESHSFSRILIQELHLSNNSFKRWNESLPFRNVRSIDFS